MKSYAYGLALAFGMATFAAAPALAVTVANQTDKPLELTIDLGAEEPTKTVEAGKSLKVDCPEGCEIRAVGLNSYGVSAKTGENLVIKDGMLQHADGASKAMDKSKK